MEFTPNKNLYKWKTTDTKRSTITEMANNAQKIDEAFGTIDGKVNGLPERVEALETGKAEQLEVDGLSSSVAQNTKKTPEFFVTTYKTGINTWLDAINQAITDASLAKGKVVLPQIEGDYEVTDHPILKSNIIMEFTGNSYIKLLQASTTGAILTTEGADVQNVSIINPLIDGNNVSGQNGIGIGGNGLTKNVRIWGGHIKNCKRSLVNGGGRAVTFQLGISDCSAIGYKATNCTTAGDVHGIVTLNNQAVGIYFDNVQAEECEELFTFYDLNSLGSDDRAAINVVVGSFMARNCGKSVTGATTTDEGGAIIFERASHVRIGNGMLVNDSTYGTIGGLFRGKGYDIELNDITFIGDATALFNGTNATSIDPVTGNASTPLQRLIADNIAHVGTVTNAVKADATMSQCYFNNIYLDNVTAILDSVAAARTDCWGKFIQKSTTKIRQGKFNYINAYSDLTFAGASNHYAELQKIGKLAISVATGNVPTVGTEEDLDVLIRRNNADMVRVYSDRTKFYKPMELTAIASASVPNNCIFLDSADNVIKKKDNTGTVTTI